MLLNCLHKKGLSGSLPASAEQLGDVLFSECFFSFISASRCVHSCHSGEFNGVKLSRPRSRLLGISLSHFTCCFVSLWLYFVSLSGTMQSSLSYCITLCLHLLPLCWGCMWRVCQRTGAKNGDCFVKSRMHDAVFSRISWLSRGKFFLIIARKIVTK